MAFIDSSVVNVALPALQKELNASITDAQWIIEAYALMLAALLLVGGAAGDRYGRRLVFLIGVGLFACASMWCGLSGSVYELILARGFQGIAAALLVPGSLSIIGASFPERQRGKAIGIWSGATAITSAAGPLLGGWLIDHLSWRVAFFINVPLAIIVLVAALLHVPESKNLRAKGGLDWPGALLATFGLIGVVYGLLESSTKGWSNTLVWSTLLFGLISLVCFVVVESRSKSPMFQLKLFRSKTFLGANLLTLMLYAALGGSLFFVPLNLIQVQGYSATAAGAAMLPLVFLLATLSRWSGGLIDRFGARLPLIIGPLIAAVGFAMFAIPDGGNYWVAFFPAITVLGLGMAITVAPLTTAVLNSVDTAFEGAASGINNAASRIASVLAIALFGIVFTLTFNTALAKNLGRVQSPPAITQAVEQQRDMLAAIKLPPDIDSNVKAAAQQAIGEAFITGFRWVMSISAFLALASAVFAWLLIGNTDSKSKLT
jgi:EmrB/QacA subfamily drug resistance transporter